MNDLDRPILMMGEMVRAILDGRKTVTRRVGPTWAKVQPGTRLWVREAHAFMTPTGRWLRPDEVYVEQDSTVYRADRPVEAYSCEEDWQRDQAPRWRPSIHMPRWASRLTLEVVSVTEEQAGLDFYGRPNGMRHVDDDEARREGFAGHIQFIIAWRSMHPDHTGPLWRIEFRRVIADLRERAGGGDES